MKTSYIPHEVPFSIGNISFLTVWHNSGYKVSFPEGRIQHSFIYTLNGSMRYSFMDSEVAKITALSGELVFIPYGTRHASEYLDTENEVEIVQFDIIDGKLPDYLNAPSVIQMENSKEIFRSFRSDLKAGADESTIYFLYRVYELFWHISKQFPKIPYKFRKLQPALEEMNMHYSVNRKIVDYAEMSGMSEPGFRRLFTEYTGFSPIEYRNRVRLREAKTLLRSGEYRIDEAAEIVGFSNLSFFCRSYKQLFGYSPGKEC